MGDITTIKQKQQCLNQKSKEVIDIQNKFNMCVEYLLCNDTPPFDYIALHNQAKNLREDIASLKLEIEELQTNELS